MATESKASPDPPQETTPSSDDNRESIRVATTNDQPTEVDSLGFEPYVRALAEFLTHPETEPPLTISVEGQWGSGKSSFMKQLRERLVANAEERGDKRALTVWFNPWRHEEQEGLWAAFVLQFLRDVSSSLDPFKRGVGHVYLFFGRFKWRAGWTELLRAILVSLFAVLLVGIIAWIALTQGWHGLEGFSAQLEEKGGLPKLVASIIGYGGGTLGSVALVISIWISFTKRLMCPGWCNSELPIAPAGTHPLPS